MRKTFRAFLIEQEKDYVYYIKSVRNIHDPEIMDKIALALTPSQLIEIKKDFFKPIRQNNDEFPAFPNTPTYALKVTLGLEINPATIVQNVATFANIFDEYLLAHAKGEKPEDDVDEDPNMDEGKESASNQNDVGEKRIGDLMRELKKTREEQEKDRIEAPVYETFATSHHGVEKIIGKPVSRGFYVVEHFDNTKLTASITGPFSAAPYNYDFVPGEKIAPDHFTMISEGQNNDKTVYEVQYDGDEDYRRGFEDVADGPPEDLTKPEQMWDVEVYDSDTGRHYNLAVKSHNKISARNKGVRLVADKESISDISRLTAIKPEISHAVN